MDKKTIIGIVLMSLIFIGYVVYNSKQQAEYQKYMEQVQAEQTAVAAAQAEESAAQVAQLPEEVTAEDAAAAAAQREVEMFGASLAAARNLDPKTITLSNDYLSVEFTTKGAMLKKVVLEEYTKYAPKDERNEKVVLFEPESAKFDMEFYVKNGLKNVPVNTSEYVFQSEGVHRLGDSQVLTMNLEVAPGAVLQYEYILYDKKEPARDYLLDFNVKMIGLSPLMASQSTIGMAWSNTTYQNERSFKNENLYTTLSYRLPGEE